MDLVSSIVFASNFMHPVDLVLIIPFWPRANFSNDFQLFSTSESHLPLCWEPELTIICGHALPKSWTWVWVKKANPGIPWWAGIFRLIFVFCELEWAIWPNLGFPSCSSTWVRIFGGYWNGTDSAEICSLTDECQDRQGPSFTASITHADPPSQ